MPKFRKEAKASSKKTTPKGTMNKNTAKMSKGSGTTKKKNPY